MSVSLLSVRCQHCGAPLSIREGLRYITCNFCQSELKVVRDADTTHTEVLGELLEKTAEIHDRLGVMEAQQEIDRLDREWEQWQERHLGRDKGGSIAIPTPMGAALTVVGGIALIVFIVLSNTSAKQVIGAAHWAVALCGIGVIVLIALGQHAQYRRYQQAKLLYENHRTVLGHKLAAARSGA